MSILLFVVGLGFLIIGAEALVRGASRMAVVLGISPLVIGFDLPVMIAVALACLPLFFTGGVISRQEGALLLGYYVAYTLYLVLAASQHDVLPEFSAVMLYFVIPLTVVTVLIVTLREMSSRKQRRSK